MATSHPIERPPPLPTDPRFIDLTGQTFGRLLVLAYDGRRNGGHVWLCRCSCGKQALVGGRHLRRGAQVSCGCYRAACHTRHGRCGTPEYKVWEGIIDRCTNPNNAAFACYGGRGIVVCERWRDFAGFFADMGERPSEAHTIDRKDNEGHYEPGNCYWATRKEQMRNTRSNHLVTFAGETLCVMEWAERLGINYSTLRKRLRKWPLDRALTTTPPAG